MDITRIIAPPLDNNIYVWGNSKEVVIIDAAGDKTSTAEVQKAVGKRNVQAVLITHGHFDHIMAKGEFKKIWDNAPIYLRQEDLFLWQERYPKSEPDQYFKDSQTFSIGGDNLVTLNTPGHTPGSTCMYWQGGGSVFTGDTLFPGGPGATRWGYSDFKAILKSIETKLFSLPIETKILPGHGSASTVGKEKPQLGEWSRRGW